jgi:FkbM family methyltransferase
VPFGVINKTMSKTFTAEELITAFYKAFLGRSPDKGGFDAHVANCQQNSLENVIGGFLESQEFMDRVSLLKSRRLLNDSSQFGEVELLLKNWVNAQACHRIVVDIGARGRERSNSYDLLRYFGWKGLLVEANPHLIPGIKQDFEGLDVQVIHCAVSFRDGDEDLYLGVNEDISSLDPAMTASWGEVSGKIRVPARRLASLLEEKGIPEDFDLLSLDIEGLDVAVFNDLILHSRFRPRWVIIEVSRELVEPDLVKLGFDQAILDLYKLQGRTQANLILSSVGTRANQSSLYLH